MRTERGGIVTGWLVRLVIVVGLLGLVAFEGGAVVIARVQVDGTADAAARDASVTYGTTRDVDLARAEAERQARVGGARLVEFGVSQDGTSVSVTLEKEASTLVIHHIGPLKNLRLQRSTHEAPVR